MYKKIILLIISLSLYANNIEINAKLFEANKNNKIGVFSGDVKIKQNKDFLNCSKLKITIDDNNKIINYIATGVSNFSITLNKNMFSGRANQIIYNVKNNTYELKGNVKIKENNKELEADYILLDQTLGTYKIKSTENNKPVKLIFEIAK